MYKKLTKLLLKVKLWFDYNPPGSMTSKGWRLFDKEFKEHAPIRYWITHDLRNWSTRAIGFRYRRISEWIRFRTLDRFHVIGTDLPPGYYEFDTRLLHSNFTLLKDFVECQQAWYYHWSESGTVLDPWYTKLPFYYRIFKYRKPELGIKYLEWASTLDDPNLPPFERSEQQARDARETLTLYLWWVKDRPAREEPKYKDYSDQGLGILGSLDEDFDHEADDYKEYLKYREQSEARQQQWDEEDTEMLVRLVKLRKGLWT